MLQVVPYKECKQGLEPQEFSETVLTPKKFIEKECIQNKWVGYYLVLLLCTAFELKGYFESVMLV